MMNNTPNGATPFYQGMRLKRSRLNTITKAAGTSGVQSQQIPRVGLLQGIRLDISVVVGGTLGTATAAGIQAAIRRVRVNVNSGQDIFNVTGQGYSSMLKYFIGSEYFGVPQVAASGNQGRSPVTLGTFGLDMYIPIAMNRRDPIGLFNLQSETSTVQLEIDFAPDTDLASTGTVAVTVQPSMDWFTIPNPLPAVPTGYVHQIIEDTRVISGAGDFTYEPLRGQRYLQVIHGSNLGDSATAADNFNRFRVLVGSSDVWRDDPTGQLDLDWQLNYNTVRPAGLTVQDYMASSELGMLGLMRDTFDTALTTDYQHILTMLGSGSLTTIRRQLVKNG